MSVEYLSNAHGGALDNRQRKDELERGMVVALRKEAQQSWTGFLYFGRTARSISNLLHRTCIIDWFYSFFQGFLLTGNSVYWLPGPDQSILEGISVRFNGYFVGTRRVARTAVRASTNKGSRLEAIEL